MWPKDSDGSDVNAVDVTKSRDIIATENDFGFVKLFTYPSPHEFAKFKQYNGHSAHVTNVRFTFDDGYLISAGGADTSLFQWRYSHLQHEEEAEVEEEGYDSDLEKEKHGKKVPRSAAVTPPGEIEEEENDEDEENKQPKAVANHSTPDKNGSRKASNLPSHGRPAAPSHSSAGSGMFQIGGSSEIVKSGRPRTKGKFDESDYHPHDNDGKSTSIPISISLEYM